MSDPDDFTELVDFDPDRVDLVGKAANGTPILVAKSADGEPTGLFEAEFVRELVAKSEAEERADGPVTVTGTPAAVAQMMAQIHGAPVRKAQMSSAEINDLPDSAFAYIEPGGEKDDAGKTTPRSKRHFPVHDEAHARNALERAPQSPFGEKAMPKIRAAAKKFGVEVAKADGDAGDPGSPAWEGQDAENAQAVLAQILALRPKIEALAAREGAEVGAGHTEDICDVFELRGAIDSLMSAAKTLAGFAVSEQAEAGESVAKAQPAASTTAATAAPSPKESTVDQTTTEVAKTEGTAAAGTEQAPVSKAAGLAQQLGISMEQLAELGAQSVLKAATEAAATQTSGAAAAPADDARVIPGTDTVQSPVQAPDEVMKAMAGSFATALSEAMAPLAKQVGDLAGQVSAQSERVEKMAQQPDNRRSPLLNGATGEPGPAGRGDAPTSPEFQAVLKALDEMPDGPARDEFKRKVALGALAARFS